MRSPVAFIGTKIRTACSRRRGELISTATHGVVLLCLLGVVHTVPQLAPNRLPGTAHGTTLLTYYAAGSPAHSVSDIPVKDAAKQSPRPSIHSTPAPPKAKEAAAPSTEVGTGTSTDSGLGQGDIKIALETYDPRPTPHLDPGTKGDVILNAVIDEHGKITGLTLLKGLGPSIDDVVIATVKQWSYTPATRNGVPIPSEQELHFHYERS